MIEIKDTDKGVRSIIINGRRLHSAYDPEKEAIKFTDTQIPSSRSPNAIIVLGEGLGYLSKTLKIRFEHAKIISIFYSKSLFSHTLFDNTLSWYPESNTTLSDFIDENIDEFECEGLTIIEWPVSAALFPEISKMSKDTISRFVRTKSGSIRTTKAMGKLWIRNSVSNFINIDDVFELKPFPQNAPIILAGSGPTLSKARDLIRCNREKIVIIALPSALEFFKSIDIIPDMIVLTDPGYYSFVHLEPMKDIRTTVCMPISATRGIWKFKFKTVFIAQPHFFETDLLSELGMKFPIIPPLGTVAATALHIALNLSSQKIICIGLDFAYDDIISHVRPNAFEKILDYESNRISPLYGTTYRRTMHFAGIKKGAYGGRTSIPLEIYADWFNNLSLEIKARIWQLFPPAQRVNKIQNIEERDLRAFLNNLTPIDTDMQSSELGKKASVPPYPSRCDRMKITYNVITNWENQISDAVDCALKTKSVKPLLQNSVLEKIYFYSTSEYVELKKLENMKTNLYNEEKINSLSQNILEFIKSLGSKISGE